MLASGPDLLVRVGDGEPESLPAGVVVLGPESVGVFDVCQSGLVRLHGLAVSRRHRV